MAGKKKDSGSIAKREADWRARTLDSTKARTENARSGTSSAIPLPDLFLPTSETFSENSYLSKLGFPGEYPFTRGVYPTMYRGRRWTMRQYAGFGSPTETNRRYRYLLDQGTTGLSVAFDLPTQMGRDSDDKLARGEVGRVGVPISSIQDMEALFDGIPLEKVSTSMTINATAHLLLGFYLVLARKRNVSWDKLRGTVQNDILKEYIARGTYIYPPKPALRIATDIFEFCRDNVPNWNTISISGYHIREAGSTAAQEVAFTLADGICYVEEALRRGLEIDSFASRLAFFFNCHNNFLEEVAKFRAARRMWAKIMKDRFKAKKDSSLMLRFHTQTAGSTLTAQQPRVNIIRTTLQALAAVMGGTQSLHTNAYDEALCLPTEESATLALRTQQVIASESGVPDVVDPFGGSYAIEALTDEIEARANEYIQRIDNLGGMLKAIELGFPQQEIEEAAFRYQQAIEKKELEVVGVNVYKDQTTEPIDLLRVDPRLEAEQVEKLKAFKSSRKDAAVRSALNKIQSALSTGENIMPNVVAGIEADLTLGEISNTLREKFGEYHP